MTAEAKTQRLWPRPLLGPEDYVDAAAPVSCLPTDYEDRVAMIGFLEEQGALSANEAEELRILARQERDA